MQNIGNGKYFTTSDTLNAKITQKKLVNESDQKIKD